MTKDGASGKRRRPDEAAQPAPKRAPPLLSWMRHASLIEEDTPGVESLAPELDERLLTSLSDGGVSRLFPVQAAVWTALRGGSFDARDICVNAPTGSGKTLAYVLPVVSALRHRVVCRLRALVVLPTHDLALQVGAVFAPLCQAVGLSMAVVSGKGALQPEADALVQRLGAPQPADEQPPELASRVDILVATPGRLVAHVQSTPGFSLAHLRWLVVDEMDRLLRQSYQDWLAVVLASTAAAPRSGSCWGSGHDGHDAAGRRFRGGMLGDRVATPRLVKVVVSATVTRDPSKLEQLQLHSPLLLSATPSDERCQFPAQLELFRTVVPADQKPFALIALLQSVRDSTVLVFTASVSSTNKLYTMLASLGHAVVGTCVEYSSMHSHQQRSEALASFRARKATVLVASDAATRGLDVEGIDVVISYDTPVYLKTYVHRVGRTARAGRPGRAYTLLRPEEVHHFKRMLKKAGDHAVNTHKVPAQELHELRARHAAVCAPLLDEEEAPS